MGIITTKLTKILFLDNKILKMISICILIQTRLAVILGTLARVFASQKPKAKTFNICRNIANILNYVVLVD